MYSAAGQVHGSPNDEPGNQQDDKKYQENEIGDQAHLAPPLY
jgi:hypothetical protein